MALSPAIAHSAQSTNPADIQEKLLEPQLVYEMDEIVEEEHAGEAAVWDARLNAAMGAEAGGEPGEEAGVRESRAA